MAEQADGEVRVDTELDTEGFKAGSDKLLAAIKALSEEIKNLRTTLTEVFKEPFTPKVDTGGAENKVAELEEKVRELQASMEELQGAGTTGNAETTTATADVDFGATTQKASGLQRQIDSVNSSVERLGPVVEKAMSGSESAISTFDDKASALENKIAGLREQLEAVGQTKFPTQKYEELGADVEKVGRKLETLLNKQEKLEDLGVNKDSKQWKSLQYDIDETAKEWNRLNAQKEQMEKDGTAFQMGVDTSQYSQLSENLEAASQKLAEMQDQIEELRQKMNAPITLTGLIKNAFTSMAEAVENVLDAIGNAVLHPFRTLNRFLGQVVVKAGQAVAALAKIAGGAIISGLKKIASAAKQAATHLAKLAGNAIKSGLSKLTGTIKNAASSLLGLKKNSSKASKGLSGNLKAILKYGFGIRSVYVLVNKLRNALISGFQNLAQYSSSVNTAISSLKTSLTTLKNSFAAAFSPILTTIAPALTKLIDLLSSAISYLGAFFAALTGAKTYTKAVAVQEDYAASLNDTADAAEEAKRQLAGFDELNVLSDNSSSSSSGNDTDASSMFEEVEMPSGISDFVDNLKELLASGDYEEIGHMIANGLNSAMKSVDTWIKKKLRAKGAKWAKKIARVLNGLVDGFDWNSLGETIADGMNAAFDILNTFLSTFDFASYGAGIGTAINGWFDSIEWDLIGQTLANKINAVWNILKGIVTTLNVNGANISSSIATGVTSWFDTIQWDTISSTLSNGINGIVISLYAFLQGVDWGSMGTMITTNLNNTISNIGWGALGYTIGSGFQSALDFIHDAISTFAWSDAGSFLGSSIEGFIQSINWAELGQTLSGGLIGAFNFLTSAIQNVDWYGLGENVRTCLVNIDWGGICESMFEAIGTVLGGIGDFIWGIVEGAWDSMIQWWYDTAYEDGEFTIEGLLTGIADVFLNIGEWLMSHIVDPFMNALLGEDTWSGLKDAGKYIVEGLYNAIIEFFSDPLDWIKEHIVDPFMNAFKKLFGISSPSTVMEEQGGFIVDGLLNGITNLANKIKEIPGKIKDWVSEKFSDAKDWLKEKGSNIVTGIKNGMEGAKNLVKDTAGSIKGWVTDKVTSVTSWLKDKGKDVISGMSDGMEGKQSLITDTAGKVKDWITDKVSKWGDAKTWGSDLCSNLADGISGAVNTVKEAASGVADKIKSFLGFSEPEEGPLSNFHTYMPDMIKLMVKGIKSNEDLAIDAVSDMADAIAEEMNDGSYTLKEIVPTTEVNGVIESFTDKITDSFRSMLDKLQAIAESVTFTVPVVASGVIPYKAATTAASGDMSDIGTTIEASNDELASVVTQVVMNAASSIVTAIQNYSGTTVNLDKNSMAEAVIQEINRRTRMTNISPLIG